MTVYAVAESVPAECDYLTAGKRYPVRWENSRFFEIEDDRGWSMSPNWKGSGFLNGGNWIRLDSDHSPDASKMVSSHPEPERAVVEKALKAARQFITNGIEFGYIRMPDANTPDSAHDTLPLIDAALSAYKQSEVG